MRRYLGIRGVGIRGAIEAALLLAVAVLIAVAANLALLGLAPDRASSAAALSPRLAVEDRVPAEARAAPANSLPVGRAGTDREGGDRASGAGAPDD